MLQDLDANAVMGASLSRDGKLLAVTSEMPANLLSIAAEAAKAFVGKKPKLIKGTYVWQIGE